MKASIFMKKKLKIRNLSNSVLTGKKLFNGQLYNIQIMPVYLFIKLLFLLHILFVTRVENASISMKLVNL